MHGEHVYAKERSERRREAYVRRRKRDKERKDSVRYGKMKHKRYFSVLNMNTQLGVGMCSIRNVEFPCPQKSEIDTAIREAVEEKTYPSSRMLIPTA
jgi:hypothetical protein